MMTAESVDQIFDLIKDEEQVVIDFWAPWCGPCKLIEPHLREAATQWGDKVTVLKVNVEEIPEASSRFNVSGLPTLILCRKGVEVKRKVGSAGGLPAILGMVD
jgi:thioredoxin 1